MQSSSIDPVTLAVVEGGLSHAVREMTIVIQRTARSPVIALGNDFSNAVYCDLDGSPEMIIQGSDQPVHLGGMLVCVKGIAERFAGRLAPGDVIIRNEPSSGGSHLADLDVVKPIFFENRLVAWACSRAHLGDIGGPVPGAYNPLAEDIFAEGLVVPGIKLIEAGQVREDLWDLVLANVRTPQLTRGDIAAQVSAVRLADRRVTSLFDKYGSDIVARSMAYLLDRAEELMRREISAMPDGVYVAEGRMEAHPTDPGDLLIACTVTISGSEMQVELSSPPQTPTYRNSYGGLTEGAVYLGVLTALAHRLPVNQGLYRPIHIDLGAPGTVLNAQRPAACGMSTSCPWENLFDAVCDAMSKVVPDRAFGGWPHVAINAVSGTDPRTNEPYGGLMHITFTGGSGAYFGQDGGGLWGTIATAGAASIGDIELLEMRLPVHFHRHEFAEDTAGPGRWRGAPGVVMEMEIVDHVAVVTHLGDGTKYPPPGRLGAEGAAHYASKRIHRKHVIRTNGEVEELPLHSVVTVGPAERIIAEIPGGGGVGVPQERDHWRIADDVKQGYVSLEAARDEYGLADLPPLSASGDGV